MFFSQVTQEPFPISLPQEQAEEPSGQSVRFGPFHVVLQSVFSPAIIFRIASCESRNARCPSDSIRKNRLARPPRSGVGSRRTMTHSL